MLVKSAENEFYLVGSTGKVFEYFDENFLQPGTVFKETDHFNHFY